MKADQHQIKKATEEIGAHMDKQKGQTKSLMSKVVQRGTRPQDIMGLSDAMVEGIYGQAYRLYNTGKYRDASQLFRLLIMLNSTEPKYAMGFAACFHMLKEYKSAADAYALAALVDADSLDLAANHQPIFPGARPRNRAFEMTAALGDASRRKLSRRRNRQAGFRQFVDARFER